MEQKHITPLKAIRLKCLDCCCGSSNEVRLCPATQCPLYPYREGHNPFIARREYTEAQREAIGIRLAHSRLLTKRAKSRDILPEGKDTTPEVTPENPLFNWEENAKGDIDHAETT